MSLISNLQTCKAMGRTVGKGPDFQDFLRPPSCSNLLNSLCNSGPAIFINVHKQRCDALALVSGNDQPLHIPLPEFSYAKADDLRNQLLAHLCSHGVRMRESQNNSRGICFKSKIGMKYILHQLWILVIKPILDALGYSVSTGLIMHFEKRLTSMYIQEPPNNVTRIWWCATGPLAFLPIHAAGIYDESQPGKVSALGNFAISSYIPTIRSPGKESSNKQ